MNDKKNEETTAEILFKEFINRANEAGLRRETVANIGINMIYVSIDGTPKKLKEYSKEMGSFVNSWVDKLHGDNKDAN